ncbi:MAG: PhnD/SsuA/transferrin family substrate-binding protein [Desulfobacteraceae bacterium]
MIYFKIIMVLPLVFAVSVVSPGISRADFDQLNIAVADCGSDQQLTEKYLPFAKYLSKKLGGSGAALKFPKDKSDLENWTKNGEIQLVIAKLEFYLGWKKKGIKVQPLVMMYGIDETDANMFAGLFIARKDSNIKSFEDMKGKTILFGSKGAFDKYKAAIYTLKERGINPEVHFKKISNGGKCPAIGKAVYDGKYDIGVVSDYTWGETLESEIKLSEMRVVGKTVLLPFLALYACTENISESQAKIVSQSAIDLSDPVILNSLKASEFRTMQKSDLAYLKKMQ